MEEVLPIGILFCTNEDDGIGKLLKSIEMFALACVVGPANEILDKIVTKCVECKVYVWVELVPTMYPFYDIPL